MFAVSYDGGGICGPTSLNLAFGWQTYERERWLLRSGENEINWTKCIELAMEREEGGHYVSRGKDANSIGKKGSAVGPTPNGRMSPFLRIAQRMASTNQR